MVECNSIETHNIYPNLNDQQQFRLNKINEFRDYFVAEIKERELMSYWDFFIFLTILINI